MDKIFLPQDRTMTLEGIASMSEEEARGMFQNLRWPDGIPRCTRCDCSRVYAYKSRPLWKCKGCDHQFTLTSGTVFACRKLPIRVHLMALVLFLQSPKKITSFQLSDDLQVNYRTAWDMANRIRNLAVVEI